MVLNKFLLYKHRIEKFSCMYLVYSSRSTLISLSLSRFSLFFLYKYTYMELNEGEKSVSNSWKLLSPKSYPAVYKKVQT